MSNAVTRILAISGSLRAASYNGFLVAAAKSLAPDGVEVEIYEEVGSLPHFSQDLEGDRTPGAVLELRRRVRAADAVLISSPEYNGSVPGALKNLIDWASRPYGESSFAGKHLAVMGASISPYGAQRAQEHLLPVLRAVGAEVVGESHPVGPAAEVFSDDGSMVAPDVTALIRQVVARLAEAARTGENPGHAA